MLLFQIECIKEATADTAPELRVTYTHDGEEKSDIYNTVSNTH